MLHLLKYIHWTKSIKYLSLILFAVLVQIPLSHTVEAGNPPPPKITQKFNKAAKKGKPTAKLSEAAAKGKLTKRFNKAATKGKLTKKFNSSATRNIHAQTVITSNSLKKSSIGIKPPPKAVNNLHKSTHKLENILNKTKRSTTEDRLQFYRNRNQPRPYPAPTWTKAQRYQQAHEKFKQHQIAEKNPPPKAVKNKSGKSNGNISERMRAKDKLPKGKYPINQHGHLKKAFEKANKLEK